MEILFKNNHAMKKELAKEIYRYFYFQRKLYIVIYILLAIGFVLNLVSVVLSPSYFDVVMLICILAVAVIPVWLYFIQVNSLIKRNIEMYGKEIEVEVIVTEDFIQNTFSTGAVNKLEYYKIKRAVQTKNLILLYTKANLVYTLRKDAFEIGTKEGFIAFLKSKNITVKGK